MLVLPLSKMHPLSSNSPCKQAKASARKPEEIWKRRTEFEYYHPIFKSIVLVVLMKILLYAQCEKISNDLKFRKHQACERRRISSTVQL